jgi:hypothetical protein
MFAGTALSQAAVPIPIKVVVVTMFERGEDVGDQPGDFSSGLNANIWTE